MLKFFEYLLTIFKSVAHAQITPPPQCNAKLPNEDDDEDSIIRVFIPNAITSQNARQCALDKKQYRTLN